MANCWGSPCCIGTFAALAVVCFVYMCVGISEKARFTPFYQEMKCKTPPVAIRFSGMSAPAGTAEAMGLTPGSPPYGLYLDMTTTTTCTNPNQADVTMKAAGSKFELLQPNLTDVALGGAGLPYTKLSDGTLERDAHFPSGGGEGKMVQVTAVGITLTDVFAISAVASVQGYAPLYVKSKVTVENKVTLFGMPLVSETTVEQWCGYYGGSCLAEIAGTNPPMFEPALCAMTKMICSSTVEDMQASLNFAALGGAFLMSMPCAPATGLPSTMNCSVVTAPGVDATTMTPVALDPQMQLTAKAQSEQDEKIDDAETMLHGMLSATIALNAILFVLFSGMVVFCFWRRTRAARTGMESAEQQAAAAPKILDGARNESAWKS